jgi:hypothetical protein
MAPLIYKPDGEQLIKRLWKETMDELAFANVEDILQNLSKQV